MFFFGGEVLIFFLLGTKLFIELLDSFFWTDSKRVSDHDALLCFSIEDIDIYAFGLVTKDALTGRRT